MKSIKAAAFVARDAVDNLEIVAPILLDEIEATEAIDNLEQEWVRYAAECVAAGIEPQAFQEAMDILRELVQSLDRRAQEAASVFCGGRCFELEAS